MKAATVPQPARIVALQALRIPALLAVLVLLGSALQTFQPAFVRVDLATVRWAWVVTATSILVFVAVALLGRAAQHPPAVLVVEAAVAGLLGLTPPWMWITSFGVSGPPKVFGLTTGSVAVPVLALTWLAIVAVTGVRQWRAARQAAAVSGEPESSHTG